MKTVVVTGATSGLGKAIYEGYKGLDGYNVIGISRHGPEITWDFNHPSNYLLYGLNVDILVNCAGVMEVINEDLRKHEIFHVNFWAAYSLIQQALRDNLLIVNIASISGMQTDPDTPIYGASKAALLSLTSSLAKKYAARGIRVNSISPGFYPTNLVPGETPEWLLSMIPLGSKGHPNDIFEIVRMFEKLEYMTGTNIVIDGGQLCKI